jgi:parallel beta-helix repeat protein
MLVENNTVYDNGSAGIESFLTDGAVITGNTLYGNNTGNLLPANDAQILINQSNNDTVTNNIMAGLAVPEPSTWAMLFIGFVGLQYLSYRLGRKRKNLWRIALVRRAVSALSTHSSKPHWTVTKSGSEPSGELQERNSGFGSTDARRLLRALKRTPRSHWNDGYGAESAPRGIASGRTGVRPLRRTSSQSAMSASRRHRPYVASEPSGEFLGRQRSLADPRGPKRSPSGSDRLDGCR